jgi:DNA-binding MarR family transcriptional regulator
MNTKIAHRNELILDNQLCFALYRASRSITRLYTRYLAPLHLTYAQYVVMVVLWESDALAVKDLGARLCLDSATLTPVLKKLESHGYLVRQRDKNDERVVKIHLTTDGRNLYAKAKLIPKQIFDELTPALSSRDVRTKLLSLRQDLHELSDVLEGQVDQSLELTL